MAMYIATLMSGTARPSNKTWEYHGNDVGTSWDICWDKIRRTLPETETKKHEI